MALELQKLKEQDCPVFIFHMKPQYLKTIQEEIDALDDKRISMLTEDEEIAL
jgi:hypothetical protein